MRTTILFIIIISALISLANMGSPLREGTRASSAVSSRDIDIVHETINIRIKPDFTAHFTIEYRIRTDSAGRQVPLLFHADAFKDSFNVTVDGQPVQLKDIPTDIGSDTLFEKFSNSFDTATYTSQRTETQIVIRWEEHTGNIYRLNDLKYFETDLSKGDHIIRVEYDASNWAERSGWVKDYSIRYSLTPAKYWRNFGGMMVNIDASAFGKPVTTNLPGKPLGELPALATWSLKELPGEFISINYTPEIKGFAKFLIWLTPMGIGIIIGSLLALLHFLAMRAHRRKNPLVKVSWVVVLGSFVVPAATLLSWAFGYEWIDAVIGKEAGGYHGYTIFILLLFPIVFIVYLILAWLIDRWIVRKAR